VALYRGRLIEPDGRRRAFRVLLFAALPDRLRAEVLSPLGTPHLVLDGGGGRVALSFPGEGVAYVGDSSPQVMGQVVGVPVALEDFVRLVLEGEPPPGTEVRVDRRPPRGGGLPQRLDLVIGPRSLRFTLHSRRPPPPDPAAVGTGAPPPGAAVLPLEDLEIEPLR
jgi:hypothetical protein